MSNVVTAGYLDMAPHIDYNIVTQQTPEILPPPWASRACWIWEGREWIKLGVSSVLMGGRGLAVFFIHVVPGRGGHPCYGIDNMLVYLVLMMMMMVMAGVVSMVMAFDLRDWWLLSRVVVVIMESCSHSCPRRQRLLCVAVFCVTWKRICTILDEHFLYIVRM
jgi:hypothetical protein